MNLAIGFFKTQMRGFIQIRAGKLYLVNGESLVTPIYSGDFIATDEVELIEGKPILIKRIPQTVIASVKSITNGTATLFVFDKDLFYPKIVASTLSVTDRVVIELSEDGNVTVIQKFSNSSNEDALVILNAYKQVVPLRELTEQKGEHLYTKDEFIYHEDLETFTIDPASTVDYDDAISVDKQNRTIYIHIVDITQIPISKTLRERCLTLYLANEHTEHLLEEPDLSKLSLLKDQRRRVITIKVALDDEWQVTHYDIYRSTIKVKERYNYDQVTTILEGQPTSSIEESIFFLANLTNERSKSVSYNINLPSIRLTIDMASGSPVSLVTEDTSSLSHTLVATAMILANLIVSRHLEGQNIPNRFHEKIHGLLRPDEIEVTGNPNVDSFILVKRYARACYSIDKRGHFGLGLTDYVHFTSPIRRYADVLIHRILAGYKYELDDEVIHINRRSSFVKSLQRTYLTWKISRSLQKGDIYEAWVIDVKPSGIIWFIPSHSLNGFTHVSTLEPFQRWVYQAETLKGPSAEIIVGKKVNATILEINQITYESSMKIIVPASLKL